MKDVYWLTIVSPTIDRTFFGEGDSEQLFGKKANTLHRGVL